MKLFFVTRLTKGGGGCYISLGFHNRTPNELELGFGINRLVLISSIFTYQNEYNRPMRYVVMTS